MRCNCENSKCTTCDGKGCKNEAGNTKAMYIGFICDGCALDMPAKYIISGVGLSEHEKQQAARRAIHNIFKNGFKKDKE